MRSTGERRRRREVACGDLFLAKCPPKPPLSPPATSACRIGVTVPLPAAQEAHPETPPRPPSFYFTSRSSSPSRVEPLPVSPVAAPRSPRPPGPADGQGALPGVIAAMAQVPALAAKVQELVGAVNGKADASAVARLEEEVEECRGGLRRAMEEVERLKDASKGRE